MKLKNLFQLIDKVHLKYKTSKPYICGGLPRDKYINRLTVVSDVDITTGDKTIEQLSLMVYKILNLKYDIQRDIKQDGHSSINFGNMKVDFSSNYIEPQIKDHISKLGISNPTPLQCETFSRDFGCNALLLSLDFKELLDPTNRGKQDCDNKIIRTLLSPDITFKVTPNTGINNRIIRSIYLACKLNFDIHKDIIDYVSKNPQLIEKTEPKTLAKKFNKSCELDMDKTIYYLNKMNLYNYIPINNMLSEQSLNVLAGGKK